VETVWKSVMPMSIVSWSHRPNPSLPIHIRNVNVPEPVQTARDVSARIMSVRCVRVCVYVVCALWGERVAYWAR
jgi:hypothetical protein